MTITSLSFASKSIQSSRMLFWQSYKRSANGQCPRDFAALVGYKPFISDNENAKCRPDTIKEALTPEEAVILHDAILNTWSQIASDIEKSAELGPFKLTNLVAVESCIDADHLSMYNLQGAWAEQIIKRLLKQFEYGPVLFYLSSIVKLR
jgi:hypothetical protein